jgi:methylmalonyl-CoA/ethylmalonyl-CoA epimerase
MSSQTPSALLSPVLGSITEVCIVTPNYKQTIDGLSQLGIGPFQVFHFNKTTVPRREWRGAAGDFELYVCFAKQGDLVIEIMQPTEGESLMAEYLERNSNREGIQHVAFDMGNIAMPERLGIMKERGFEPAMQGWWTGKKGVCHFCFFDTEGRTGTVFETIDFSDDWEDPEHEWYPHPPAANTAGEDK